MTFWHLTDMSIISERRNSEVIIDKFIDRFCLNLSLDFCFLIIYSRHTRLLLSAIQIQIWLKLASFILWLRTSLIVRYNSLSSLLRTKFLLDLFESYSKLWSFVCNDDFVAIFFTIVSY